MKKLFFPGAILLFLVSCNANESENEPVPEPKDTTEAAHVMIPASSCYASYKNKDTILLKVEVFPNVVNGVLKYRIEGKDSNEGTIDGKMAGDTLFADYTFVSEGVSSVREVAFLLGGDTVTEGFGDTEESNGRMVFKNRASIDFSKGIKFTKIDCVQNDDKFRVQ